MRNVEWLMLRTVCVTLSRAGVTLSRATPVITIEFLFLHRYTCNPIVGHKGIKLRLNSNQSIPVPCMIYALTDAILSLSISALLEEFAGVGCTGDALPS